MKAGWFLAVITVVVAGSCSGSHPPAGGAAPAPPDAPGPTTSGGESPTPAPDPAVTPVGPVDASPGTAPDAPSGAPADGAPTGAGAPLAGWYEAEAIPPNQLSGSTLTVNPPKPRPYKCKVTCATTPPKAGEDCCSGGGEITWLTQGIGPIPGGLTFNGVAAASDGMYDVTWWYHCGASDNFGDKHCGGQTDPPTTPAGCRPHQIVVNGTEMPGTYHFPCFATSFGLIHPATTRLPLKAGMNAIKVYPKARDSADMDAIHVQPAGMGIGPLITSNNVSGAN
jgi:hypothetical protein